MKNEYIELNFIKYQCGYAQPQVLIDAVHAASPKADTYTGEIVDQVTKATSCHCIIAIVSRKIADLNRPCNGRNDPAIKEYRETLNKLLKGSALISLADEEQVAIPFLHLAIHGMRDIYDLDIELVLCQSLNDG